MGKARAVEGEKANDAEIDMEGSYRLCSKGERRGASSVAMNQERSNKLLMTVASPTRVVAHIWVGRAFKADRSPYWRS